ncbi:MAG: P-type DNA transfer ATPase VirB11 [Pseudomonadota bacterium]|jgi:type IV secretion system protein VirB11|nr:P-type DNA transfer ATPase VirB11 [Pseudomonadota bacterium]
MISAQRVYLDAFLAPLAASLSRGDVTDLYINRPGELWLETAVGIERHENVALDDASLWRLARQIAAASDQGINREHPLLAATLPDGARVQICAPPATRGNVIVAIRKHSMPDLRLTDYLASGAFAKVGAAARAREAVDAALADLLASGNTIEFLSAAVRRRKTMVIAGGTGTGKTTFLNALLKEAPSNERFVLIEDTPEIQLHHQNAVGLVAVRGKLGEASVSPAELVEAALRLRPDRIIMGEVRGAEAISWLRAVGTGHPGSITTVHANSPSGAIEQLAMMSMSAGTELGRAELIDYIKATVDVFVQLGQEDGARLVTEIQFNHRVKPSAAGPETVGI